MTRAHRPRLSTTHLAVDLRVVLEAGRARPAKVYDRRRGRSVIAVWRKGADVRDVEYVSLPEARAIVASGGLRVESAEVLMLDNPGERWYLTCPHGGLLGFARKRDALEAREFYVEHPEYRVEVCDHS